MNFDRISKMSQMIVGGQVMYKFDHIAVIYIDGRHYFNVYRRYNSPYNIMIEDYNLDVHLHQDYTLRTSLKNILCLSDTTNMYMLCADSFKHNGPIITDILDMRWSEIQTQYQAANVHLGGVFEPSQTTPSMPTTPINQPINPLTEPPPIMRYTLLTPLIIPNLTEEPKAAPSDHPSMSLKYIDIKSGRGDSCHMGCYCEYDDSDDNASEEDNYMLLRSGTIVNKNL
jgi:hypothetical protein